MYKRCVEGEETTGEMEIGSVLDLLSDKEWHSIDDVVEGTRVPKIHVLKIVNFFRDFGFIEISMGGEKVKIDKDYVDL